MTFVVTDIVDSSDVLSSLGETRSAALQRVYLALLRGALASTGGHEVKSLGDGVTATFDSPPQAVAYAVAIRSAVERHNASGRERLDVRAGIAVGEVADGVDQFDGNGSLRGPHARARRLCESALGGQILVSNLVATLIERRNGYVVHPVGLLQMNGFSEPMAAFEVEHAGAQGADDDAEHVALLLKMAAAAASELGMASLASRIARLVAAVSP